MQHVKSLQGIPWQLVETLWRAASKALETMPARYVQIPFHHKERFEMSDGFILDEFGCRHLTKNGVILDDGMRTVTFERQWLDGKMYPRLKR